MPTGDWQALPTLFVDASSEINLYVYYGYITYRLCQWKTWPPLNIITWWKSMMPSSTMPILLCELEFEHLFPPVLNSMQNGSYLLFNVNDAIAKLKFVPDNPDVVAVSYNLGCLDCCCWPLAWLLWMTSSSIEFNIFYEIEWRANSFKKIGRNVFLLQLWFF